MDNLYIHRPGAAVQNGTADMAHTAAIYWSGKMPSAPLFTTAPFGLTPREHMTWIDAAGGQTLWDELYADFGVKPFMAGNTEFNMAGWYNRQMESKEDLVGLKVRIVGLGAEILRQLGATPVSMPTSEVFGALQSGVVDGAELLGPYSDSSLGMQKVAKYYYGPGFNKPNGKDWAVVNLGLIQQFVVAGKLDAAQPIDEAMLVAAGVTGHKRDGIRILAKGEISVALTLNVSGASAPAIEAIEKAGGSITLRGPKEEAASAE